MGGTGLNTSSELFFIGVHVVNHPYDVMTAGLDTGQMCIMLDMRVGGWTLWVSGCCHCTVSADV